MNVSREEVIVSAMSSLIVDEMNGREDFNLAEEFTLRRGHELLCKAFARALEAFDQLLFDEDDLRFSSKGFESRSLLTCFGPVTFDRRRYKNEAGSVYLLDEALGIEAHTRVSPTLTFLVAGLGLESSYQKAADGLAAYIGVSEHATFVKRALAKVAESIKDLAPDEIRRRIPALDVEADGTYVHRQRTKAQKAQDKAQGKTSQRSYTEVGTFIAYEGKHQVGKNKKARINCLHHASTAKTPVAWEEFGQMIATRWDTDALFVTNLATDGAAGYRAGEKYLPGEVISGYDLHHIISVLSPAFGCEIAHEVFGVMRGYGFNEGYQLLVDYRDWYVSQGAGEHCQKASDFIAAHADQIRAALIYNLGTIESTNAHLIGSRLKRFGGGWSSGLEPMVRLRAHKASKRKLPKAHRVSSVSLPERTQARSLQETEAAIAKLEAKAHGLKWQHDTSDDQPLYYHQTSVAHTKSKEACHSLLHLWN